MNAKPADQAAGTVSGVGDGVPRTRLVSGLGSLVLSRFGFGQMFAASVKRRETDSKVAGTNVRFRSGAPLDGQRVSGRSGSIVLKKADLKRS